jgi:elongation factor Ts
MILTIEDIRQLRNETNAGVMECRQVLEQANGDVALALTLLRERGLEKAVRNADRPATQGMIETYSHAGGRIGVMVEINSETDFAARSAALRTFAHEIALQVAASAPRYVRDEDIPAETLEEETQQATERARQAGKPQSIWARIVEGQLRKFRDMNVLLRQAYIRDENLTIDQLLGQVIVQVGENVIIRRFVRWEMEPGE